MQTALRYIFYVFMQSIIKFSHAHFSHRNKPISIDGASFLHIRSRNE